MKGVIYARYSSDKWKLCSKEWLNYYSSDLAEKVIRGMTENALKCKYNGGGVPVGYIIDNEQYFQINPITAPAILDAFNLYASGTNIKNIVDILNDRGVITNRGKSMSINSQLS